MGADIKSPMNEEERWTHLVQLDEELLRGGFVLTEWCSFIVREADTAFASGANLASILTAVSGIETFLRSEAPEAKRARLVDLINGAMIDEELRQDLHVLRKYRNSWVHVDDPWEDEKLLGDPEAAALELEQMALFAARTLRRTIYSNPWI